VVLIGSISGGSRRISMARLSRRDVGVAFSDSSGQLWFVSTNNGIAWSSQFAVPGFSSGGTFPVSLFDSGNGVPAIISYSNSPSELLYSRATGANWTSWSPPTSINDLPVYETSSFGFMVNGLPAAVFGLAG
jgi:hypothetical protein